VCGCGLGGVRVVSVQSSGEDRACGCVLWLVGLWGFGLWRVCASVLFVVVCK
jgi:hypothetical protein